MRKALPQLRARPELDRLFDALADAERLRLLQQLQPWGSTAVGLAPKLGWTQDETSKQLNLLKRAGLVESGRLGRKVEFARATPALNAARIWFSDLWHRAAPVRLEDAEVVSLERQVALAAALRTAGRRNMLECMCRGGPITQGAAAEHCGLLQGHASRGLNQLIDVGLVTVRSAGPPRRYAAWPEGLGAAMRWLHAESLVASEAEAYRRRIVEARAARAVAPKRK